MSLCFITICRLWSSLMIPPSRFWVTNWLQASIELKFSPLREFCRIAINGNPDVQGHVSIVIVLGHPSQAIPISGRSGKETWGLAWFWWKTTYFWLANSRYFLLITVFFNWSKWEQDLPWHLNLPKEFVIKNMTIFGFRLTGWMAFWNSL